MEGHTKSLRILTYQRRAGFVLAGILFKASLDFKNFLKKHLNSLADIYYDRSVSKFPIKYL